MAFAKGHTPTPSKKYTGPDLTVGGTGCGSVTIPARFVPAYQKAMAGHSMTAAIKSKCADCVGYENAVKEVGKCEITHCPLWPYRPYQRKETHATVQH